MILYYIFAMIRIPTVNFILYNVVNKKFSISFSNEALQVFFFFFLHQNIVVHDILSQ